MVEPVQVWAQSLEEEGLREEASTTATGGSKVATGVSPWRAGQCIFGGLL